MCRECRLLEQCSKQDPTTFAHDQHLLPSLPSQTNAPRTERFIIGLGRKGSINADHLQHRRLPTTPTTTLLNARIPNRGRQQWTITIVLSSRKISAAGVQCKHRIMHALNQLLIPSKNSLNGPTKRHSRLDLKPRRYSHIIISYILYFRFCSLFLLFLAWSWRRNNGYKWAGTAFLWSTAARGRYPLFSLFCSSS